MIIKFNPLLFTCGNREVYSKLSKIILESFEDRFLWDLDNVDELLFSNDFDFYELDFCKQFLSVSDKGELEQKISDIIHQESYQTDLHKKYLAHITVGLGEAEISPENAYNILTRPSLLILENHINDFKFLKGTVFKYANHSKRKNIYKKIEKAIEKYWLVGENAGGSGGIQNTIQMHMGERYIGIYQYKLFTIFDSDRENNSSFNTKYKNLINFLKNTNKESIKLVDLEFVERNDKISWHILYKRELENYVPIEVLNQKLDESQQQLINNKTLDELDFDDYESILGEEVKKDFPNYFLEDWTRDKLEKRCEHHKVSIELPNGTLKQVSEIEQILLKIAKII